MNVHKGTYHNHRVRIVLRDGEVILGRFLRNKQKWSAIEVNGEVRRLRIKDIRTFSVIGRAVAEAVAR